MVRRLRQAQLVSATVTALRRPTCPWCDEPVHGHPEPVAQVVLGWPVIICAYAPVAELLATPVQARADSSDPLVAALWVLGGQP